jgi:hypothetical protein
MPRWTQRLIHGGTTVQHATAALLFFACTTQRSRDAVQVEPRARVYRDWSSFKSVDAADGRVVLMGTCDLYLELPGEGLGCSIQFWADREVTCLDFSDKSRVVVHQLGDSRGPEWGPTSFSYYASTYGRPNWTIDNWAMAPFVTSSTLKEVPCFSFPATTDPVDIVVPPYVVDSLKRLAMSGPELLDADSDLMRWAGEACSISDECWVDCMVSDERGE